MVFIRVPKAEGIVFLYAMLMRFGPLNDIESDAGRVVGQRRLNVHGELVVVRQGDADRVFESAAQLVNRAYAVGNENPLRLADAGGPAPLVYPSVPTVVPSAVKQNVIAALRAVQRLQPIVDPVNPQLFRINHDVADVCAVTGRNDFGAAQVLVDKEIRNFAGAVPTGDIGDIVVVIRRTFPFPVLPVIPLAGVDVDGEIVIPGAAHERPREIERTVRRTGAAEQTDQQQSKQQADALPETVGN